MWSGQRIKEPERMEMFWDGVLVYAQVNRTITPEPIRAGDRHCPPHGLDLSPSNGLRP